MTNETETEAAGAALIIPEKINFSELFASGDKVEQILTTIEAEVRKTVIPVDTAKDRKAIASLAYKVSQAKTLLDGKGKEQVEDQKKAIAVVDALRKTIRDRMDALRDEARKPLDDWEAEEALRKHQRDLVIQELSAGDVTEHSGEEEIKAAIDQVASADLSLFTDEDELAEVHRLKEKTIHRLKDCLVAAERARAEQEELAQLRAEKAARAQEEEERRAAQAEKDRQAQIEKEKAEAAERAAEAAAQEAQRAIDEANERAAQAERDAAEAAERAEAEKKRAADEAAAAERQRIADEKRRAEEDQARRERNQRARNAAGKAIMTSLLSEVAGISEEHARAAATAMLDGKINRVKVEI